MTDSAGISECFIQWNIGSSTNGLWLQSMIATQGGANQWLVELWNGSTLLWGSTPPLPFHRLVKSDGFKLGFDSSRQNATISLNGGVKYASSVRIPSNQPRVYRTSQVLVFVGSASGLTATFTGWMCMDS